MDLFASIGDLFDEDDRAADEDLRTIDAILEAWVASSGLQINVENGGEG